MTYGELENSASRIARELRASGVTAGKLAAIWLKRSPEFIHAALGAMKSGCAYLPLDTSWPRERVKYILADSGAVAVLTSSACGKTLPDGAPPMLRVDEVTRDGKRQRERLSSTPKSDDLAYVIYTSGSTGKPKGVEVTHANLLHLVHWHLQAFGISVADRATVLSSVGFDASVWETWPYLTKGARLHIAPEAARFSPTLLRDWLLAEGITVSFVPTPMAERLLQIEWPSAASLRFLLTGADLLQSFPPPDLPFVFVNNYGPTECTVVTTSGVVCGGGACPPIGKPIGEARVYVLDEKQCPVPSGGIGELCIGGPGVARGYRNDLQLTAEKFVANPFGGDNTERMYRTGDLVRMRRDGELDFVGRIDMQVKVQGYRVEPNEVRVALGQHPSIEACYVAPHRNRQGATGLVAYVVFKAGQTGTGKALREHLVARVPNYMIPAQFIALDALPLTSAGKIDREALPALDSSNALPDDSERAVCPSAQSRVIVMLEELLHQLVQPYDNFFLLGGHSLLGAQLILRIQETFGVALALRDIFDHPTAVGIATEIARAEQRRDALALGAAHE